MSDAANPEAPANPAPPGAVLVLGIGNVLWADEGFGVRAVEALHAGWTFPPEVRLMDGGTLGLGLFEDIAGASHVLVFDAVDCGLPGGTLKVLRLSLIHISEPTRPY